MMNFDTLVSARVTLLHWTPMIGETAESSGNILLI